MDVQFKGTKDGKTLLESANWEVEPKTDMSYEEWNNFITGFLTQNIYGPMETKAKQKAAGTIRICATVGLEC